MLNDVSIIYGLKVPLDRRKQFNGNTWCISDLYLKCLGRYHTGNFKKAIINVYKDKACENLIEDMVDVILVNQGFDFDEYFQLDNNIEKKKMLLDLLQKGLMTIAEHEGWKTDPLLDAYNCCLKKNLQNTWLRKDKYFLSPNKKYYGGVVCSWDIEKFEVFILFLNKQKDEIKKVKIYERDPWDVDPMGKMGWDKMTGEFYLFSKNEKQKWVANP